MTSTYNILASTDESTVVSEYTPIGSTSEVYQSEAELEKEFIALLTRQGYDYLPIHTEEDLVNNLRKQLEEVNKYQFSDKEWDFFFKNVIANENEGIAEKTRTIQQDNVKNLKRDDGSTKNITLIDKKNVHNNRLQVINQYENNEGNHDNRYDCTILVNGFPLVHIELKRRGVDIREAFNQINRYQRDSFWAGSGLYQYVQIFVISNGTYTKYYSNTTREQRIKESNARGTTKKTSNSFEFTSYWADAKNRVIPDLIDFTKTFFARHTILNILTRFCVLTSEDLLLVMRPYQITATEKILNKINIATNYKKDGSIEAGGYIWHTTGSGKTLTSFKTAQLAADLPYIYKVLFVVDRKDLDYQTMKEYDRFEKGAADGNTSTKVLERQLSNLNKQGRPHTYRIIITTIQKLSNFVSKNKDHPVSNEKVVIIFDECHRSQFGEMHSKIIKFFKHYYLFGFTGTPIFAENAHKGNPKFATTAQLFGEKLHTYTIVNAINDQNVLPFRIDYINTMEMKDKPDKEVEAIATETALASPERISKVVSYVLEHFDQKTKRNNGYFFSKVTNIQEVVKSSSTKEEKEKKRLVGFNSIFAVQSIPVAIQYYDEFRKQNEELGKKLKIATIFTYSANEEEPDGVMADEDMDTNVMDASSRDALDRAIKDYNKMFKTNYSSDGDKFENYYKDVSLRMKNKELDLLIVVNMFLTGFDATTLNTLWVDKNLRMHGLLQAFSRTNRILNSVKNYGNIVCFRNLQDRVEESIGLFGDKDADSIVLLKAYEDYYYGYEDKDKHHKGYKEIVEELLSRFPISSIAIDILGEKEEKEFIALYGSLLRVMNILTAFDKFEEEQLLNERQLQDYQSHYLTLYEKYRKKVEKESIEDDIVFEIELVKQVEVNIDYILNLVEQYHSKNMLNKEAVANVLKAVDSSMQLRSKKQLIEDFLNRVNVDTDIQKDWRSFVEKQREKDLQDMIEEENLKPEETRKYLEDCFENGQLRTAGLAIDNIMPPVSVFGGKKAKKKTSIIEKLTEFFEKYFGV